MNPAILRIYIDVRNLTLIEAEQLERRMNNQVIDDMPFNAVLKARARLINFPDED